MAWFRRKPPQIAMAMAVDLYGSVMVVENMTWHGDGTASLDLRDKKLAERATRLCQDPSCPDAEPHAYNMHDVGRP